MANWTQKNLQNKGIAQVNGTYQKLSSDSPSKVKKLPNLLEGALDAPNQKVKNATKIVKGDVKFDSKLEVYMYELLQGAGIAFEFQKVIVIQPTFKYGGKCIRAVKVVVDFYLKDHNVIIDTKGFATPVSTLKYKLLKYFYFSKDEEPTIYMPSAKSECNFLINQLLYGKK